ncbi:DUF2809 domain-containing protein [Thiotrichales bacterium HSG1]|nr:DUF2809 domain-containing protein [Thiotrichales bacterium HSG1]
MVSRSYPLPPFIAAYAGDTLWALMVFLLFGFMFPTMSIIKVAIIALLFSFCIEFSQLYHDVWIDELRQNRLVALVIGRGFLWTDLICYSVGIFIGVVMEFGYFQLNKLPLR